MTYERAFGRYLKRLGLPDTHIGQWLLYRDLNGMGYAQPDAYIIFPGAIFVFECKLTQTETAFAQMRELYAPLLRELYQKPVVCIQVCKNLRRRPPAKWEISRITDLIHATDGQAYTWHWLA